MFIRQLPNKRRHGLNVLGFVYGLFDRAHHIEGLLGHVIALAIHNHFETLDRVIAKNAAKLQNYSIRLAV